MPNPGWAVDTLSDSSDAVQVIGPSVPTDTRRISVKGSSIWTPADAALTRPANTTATAVNGAIGSAGSALFKFSNFFEANAAHELLTALRLTISLAAGITAPTGILVRAHLFNADVSATVLSSNADAGTYKEMLAAAPNKLGYVDFISFASGGSGSDAIEGYGTPVLSPLHLKAAAAAADLYAILVAQSAYTPVSASVHTLLAARASL